MLLIFFDVELQKDHFSGESAKQKQIFSFVPLIKSFSFYICAEETNVFYYQAFTLFTEKQRLAKFLNNSSNPCWPKNQFYVVTL